MSTTPGPAAPPPPDPPSPGAARIGCAAAGALRAEAAMPSPIVRCEMIAEGLREEAAALGWRPEDITAERVMQALIHPNAGASDAWKRLAGAARRVAGALSEPELPPAPFRVHVPTGLVPLPAGRLLLPELGAGSAAVEQALADLDARVRAAGFKSVGDMVDRLVDWLTKQREEAAVIDGVLTDLDGQLADAGFPHAEGGSLAARLRAALRSVAPSAIRVRRLLQKVRGAFNDAVANAPTSALGEQRREAMDALEAFLLAPEPDDFAALWRRFLGACGYTQPAERLSMTWVIDLAKARKALAGAVGASAEPPTAASLAQAIDDAERAYLTFHRWKPAPTGRPDFWIDPMNACPWPRAGAIGVQRDRDAARGEPGERRAVDLPVYPDACACFSPLPGITTCATCGRGEAEHPVAPPGEDGDPSPS